MAFIFFKKPSSLSSSNAQPKSNPAPLGQPSKLSSVASPTEEKHVSSAAKPVSSTSNRSQSKTTKEADGWGDSEWGELEDWSSDSFQNKGIWYFLIWHTVSRAVR